MNETRAVAVSSSLALDLAVGLACLLARNMRVFNVEWTDSSRVHLASCFVGRMCLFQAFNLNLLQ
jgi:hypothetical protein